MVQLAKPFLDLAFLRSALQAEYDAFRDSDKEAALVERLRRWAIRTDLKETSAEAAFIEEFFRATWGYTGDGQQAATEAFSLYPKFAIKTAGGRGGTGIADAVLGWFNREGVPPVPQVVCEFKDIRSSLDAPQSRSNPRSPVRQAMDYLHAARRSLMGGEAVVPTWAIVTDMNEFRLYWSDRGHHEYLGFTIAREDLLSGGGITLTDTTETARFQRFLFARLLSADFLLSLGGRCRLEDLIRQQWVVERNIEKEFYQDYRAYRLHLFDVIRAHNADSGLSAGKMLRLAQKLLDRFIFMMFCEDMGQRLAFPPQILRDFLRQQCSQRFYDADDTDIWQRLKRLFAVMDKGGKFGTENIGMFNGGLFAHDPDIETLDLPNNLFCLKNQAENEATVYGGKQTLLYFSATYSFTIAADNGKNITLYTLGRIFEQSITELEMLEAQVDNRASLNNISRRKTDGVYYTPEWVVDRIAEDTLRPILTDWRKAAGWPDGAAPSAEMIALYETRLKAIKVVDPACGSGAFLISVLRFLMGEHETLHLARKDLGLKTPLLSDERQQHIVNHILAHNIYGVDLSPSSVEIARLSLWLHTANSKSPLSSLQTTVVDGNSLIAPDFDEREGAALNDHQRELINSFDWQMAFPDVFAAGGFDAVVGNPPYVKLQNFVSVYPEMAAYLRRDGIYTSTSSGNFDLYLPFIEKGLALLAAHGRMGYIAPSLWVGNDYGTALRQLVRRGQHLDAWVDFKAFQVFDEAITYTALQYFTKAPSPYVKIFVAADGDLNALDWSEPSLRNDWSRLPETAPWLLAPGNVCALIDRLQLAHPRLDDDRITQPNGIYVGLQTSADQIYHLEKLGPNLYRAHPKGEEAAPYEVTIEDALMKPLVSGPEAKRYQRPVTDT
jgi:hypothetical protein